MSRFFDALREASRSGKDLQKNPPPSEPPSGNEPDPGEGVWSALGIDHLAPHPVRSEEQAAAAGQGTNGAAAPSKVWKTTPEDLFDSFGRPNGELVGTSTKIDLDRKARLIPNAISPSVVEHYRRLRTKIMQQQATMPFKTLLVTSPNPQEGKSVTVMNLGLSFAMLTDYRVLIVDGDLRRGSLGRWLGIDDQPGVCNLVDGSATVESAVFKCEDSPLHFMLRGSSELPPGELLQSANLTSVFRRLGESFDLVLVDSPPVNLMTDASLLAEACDAVLLIARAYSTSRKSFEKAVTELRPFRMIGTVLNGGTRARTSSRYKGYYFKDKE